MTLLLEPFGYGYMANAIWVSALVGAVCGALSAFLVLKGWSLIGDALSHAIVPGVALAFLTGLPLALGAFLGGGAAAGAMLWLSSRTRLKPDAVIGVVFTTFFGAGLFAVSVAPVPIDVKTIVMGNILGIAPQDMQALALTGGLALAAILLRWKDLMLVFFDEGQARAVGLRPDLLKLMFFACLTAATVAAMQAVGALLVVALVITPGATALLLTDRFGRMLALATGIGAVTAGTGAWASYFLDGATGGIIVTLQTLVFLAAFALAPKHGALAGRRGRAA